MMTRKTGNKTGTVKMMRSPRNGAETPTGAHPGNTGGKKGRSGRRSEKLVDFLAKLRQEPAFHEALQKAAHDHESRNFGSVLKLLAEYDTEKPAKSVSLSASDDLVKFLKDL